MRKTSIFLIAACLVPAAALTNPGGSGGSAPSMSAPTFDAAAEYRKGIEALKASNFAEAKKALMRVLDVAPKDANANYLAGLAYAGLNDLKGARRFFEKAVKYDSEMVLARQELGVTYAKLGDKPKAEAELSSLKAMSDKCGAACPQADQLKSAMAALTAALGQGPQASIDTRPALLFASAEQGDRAYLDGGLTDQRGPLRGGDRIAAQGASDVRRASGHPHLSRFRQSQAWPLRGRRGLLSAGAGGRSGA